MKVAYVTPRYGEEIVGGAEHAARMLAERLVAQLGWEVEALTSCATDASTWANTLTAGEVNVNGVTVRRFPVTTTRSSDFLGLSAKVHRNPRLSRRQDQERWVDAQGPLAPSLVEAIGDSDADVIVFYPYLYYPTVRGIAAAGQRAVMHPAAHDEIPIRMSIYAQVFANTQGFVFQTDGERRLVEQLFPIADRPQLLLGLGVEPKASSERDEKEFRTKYSLGDRPYLLCIGRVDEGKGSNLLARYFIEMKRRHATDVALVFVGPVMSEMEKHNDIIVTGVVSEEDKWAALRGTTALVSPSPFEAFSLALIEGWAAGKPTLVNAACLATREHVERSGGGLWFDGYASFESAIQRLLFDEKVSSRLAEAGQSYVESHFHWPVLIERYGRFVLQIANRTSK